MGSILNSLILVDLGVPPLYETSTSIPLLRPALSLVSSPGHVFFTHDRSYLYHPRMDAYLKLDNIGWFGRVNECNTIVYFTWCIKEMHAVTFCIFWFWHDQHVRDTMEKKVTDWWVYAIFGDFRLAPLRHNRLALHRRHSFPELLKQRHQMVIPSMVMNTLSICPKGF